MYQAGDLIFYGSTGVCRIIDVSVKAAEHGPGEKLYYTLQPLYQGCTIFIPADNPKVFMRPILSREEADRLIDRIPSIRAEAFHSRALSELSQHYEQAFRSHNCEDLLELTMSIYAKRQELLQQKRKFGAVDERFLRRGEDLLFGELAAALEIPRDAVPQYIADRIDRQR